MREIKVICDLCESITTDYYIITIDRCVASLPVVTKDICSVCAGILLPEIRKLMK